MAKTMSPFGDLTYIGKRILTQKFLRRVKRERDCLNPKGEEYVRISEEER